MSDNDRCQNHPDRPVTARCVRFNRRFCELDFQEGPSQASCLSPASYCEFRPQCLVWAKYRARRKKQAESIAPEKSGIAAVK